MSALQVVLPPAFLGGRLRFFNRVLRAVAEAGDPSHVQLVLDANRLRASDLRLPIQNAHGDVVHLDVPDHGKLGHGSRAAVRNALLDTLPQTAELEPALDLLLPQPLQTPLESAAELWPTLFPGLGVECIPRGAPSPEESPAPAPITWLAPRHQQCLQELGLSVEDGLAGEAHCRRLLPTLPAGELGDVVLELKEHAEARLKRLKGLAEEVDSSLVGAWVRFRRDLRGAVDEFASKAERCGKNRLGVRAARLHALAQALRPHDQAQEDGLSLLSAVASFPMDWRELSGPTTTLSACGSAKEAVLTL